MLLRKHQYIVLASASLSVFVLANCADNDGPSGSSGGSGAGRAGADAGASAAGHAGAGAGAGAGGKAEGGSSHAGANSSAGEPSETAGDSSEGGGAGKPGAGAGGTAGGGSGGIPNGGSNNTGDAGEGGMGDDGGAAGTGGPTGPHANAILKYTFDEGTGLVASDSSGSGLNGTVSVGTAWTAQGRNGAGLALTGGVLPTTYVTVPPGVFKNVTATTIATWVKLNADLQWARIFDFGNGLADPANRFIYLTPHNAPQGVFFSTYGGPGREPTASTGTYLPLNVWKHVAVTIADGGKRTMYLDGFPAAESTTLDVPPSELEPLSAASYLGKSRFADDPGLNGTLDEFMVYDRVLAPAEIAALAAPKADYTRIPFDEGTGTTSADSSTRAVNATLNGATWASGRLGAAVQLSGANQYVTLANPLAGCTDSLTIAMWVKEVAAGNFARLLDFGGTNDNFMFLTANGDAGKMRLSIHVTGNETIVLSPTTLPADSTWHHVAIVVSPAAASIYVDGALGGTTLTPTNPVTPAVLGVTNEHWLGKSRFSVDPYFNGSFDEVRISCRAYTADEIKSLAFH